MEVLPLLTAAIALAVAVAGDDSPKCVKIDECSCRLKNTDKDNGLINLRPQTVQGLHEPRFADYLQYDKYYYNPCTVFKYPPSNYQDDGVLYTNCDGTTTAVCRKQGGVDTFLNIGMINTTVFTYNNGSLHVKYTAPADFGRVYYTDVELVCDENETLGKFETTYQGMISYSFRLTSRCACPGKCRKSTSDTECIGIDHCRCARLDGSYAVNLHALDNPYEPMQDRITPNQTMLYNPCSPISECGEEYAVCMKDGATIVGLGLANSSKFVTDKDGQVNIQYTNGDTRSIVQLKCDKGARDKPFFKLEGTSKNKYVMSVYSVCACNGECTSPTDDCVKSDTCSCQLKENGKQFSLHPLDNPDMPLTVKDELGYIYYYNPCSGLSKMPSLCQHAGACQEDPNTATGDSIYYVVGGIMPSVSYSNGTVTLHYTGDDYRKFDVRLICDQVDTPIFAVDGHIPQGALYYNFTLTTKHACLY